MMNYLKEHEADDPEAAKLIRQIEGKEDWDGEKWEQNTKPKKQKKPKSS